MRSRREKMLLETQTNNYCTLCMEVPPDPHRDDNLCTECGAVNDRYSSVEYLEQLNLESENGWKNG